MSLPSQQLSKHHLKLAFIGLVLLTYGSTGVFRYGLHTVLDCEHCTAASCCTKGSTAAERQACQGCSCCHTCEVQLEATAVTSDSCCPAEQNSCEVPHKSDSAGTLVAAEGYCPICAFLAQAQTPAAVPTNFLQVTYVAGQPVPSETLAPDVLTYTPHARGPPTV
ncbi:MAG: hypothetical protein RH917_13035 [Lacipirellulaceae bacterium]